jgi:hypothetical protein
MGYVILDEEDCLFVRNMCKLAIDRAGGAIETTDAELAAVAERLVRPSRVGDRLTVRLTDEWVSRASLPISLHADESYYGGGERGVYLP